jgi:hypothetical protein
MASNRFSSMLSRRMDSEGAISAPTLNVTKIVSISVALFAVIAQLLDAIGAISLSTTQQVTVWLVAAGLIVLLSIADMACRAHVTAAKYRSGKPAAATPDLSSTARPEPPGPPEPLRVVPDDGLDPPTPVPVKDENAVDDAAAPQNDPRLPVKMANVFPEGCYLVPLSISETYDYDEKAKTCRPSTDEITGKRVYQCRVVDMDPEREGHSRETVVKIVADQLPVPPTQAQYEPVEFEGLTATPHVTDRGQVAYASLRAMRLKEAIPRPAPGTEDTRPAAGTEDTRPAAGTEDTPAPGTEDAA